MPPKRSNTVEALLAGAEQAFAERGFHGASIGYICQCAGKTTGAFYSNYDSKMKLFLDLFKRHGYRIAERIETEVAEVDTAKDLAPQLARIFAGIARISLGTQALFLTLEFRLMAVKDETAGAALIEQEQRLSRRTGDLLDELFDRAGLRPALDGYELAGYLGALTRGVMLDRGAYESSGTPDPLQFDMMCRALEGLFKPVGGVGAARG